MSPDYLDYMTDEETYRQKQLSWLYKEPMTVDMEDILSVHGDEDFDNNLRAILAGSGREYIRPQMPDNNASYGNDSLHTNDVSQYDEFLQALNSNKQNIAGRLRFAYLTDDETRTRRMDIYALKRLRQIKDKVEQIYQSGRGDKSRVKQAILTGRGNAHSNYVPLGDSVSSYANDTSGYSIWNILYRAAGSSPISATELVTVIAGTLAQIVGLFPHDAEAEAAFQRDNDVVDGFNMLSDQFSPPRLSGSRGEQIRTVANGDSALRGTEQDSRQSSPDGTGGTRWKSMLEDGSYKGPIGTAMDWIADNPGKTILIAAALVSGGILIKRALERTPAAREVDGVAFNRKRETRKSSRKKVTWEELV